MTNQCRCHIHMAKCPLCKAAPKMYEALLEITEGAGPYSRDRLEHAANCIEYMKSIADKALEELK